MQHLLARGNPSYKVRDVGLAGDVLDGELGDECALVVVEDQLVIWQDVNKVRAHI